LCKNKLFIILPPQKLASFFEPGKYRFRSNSRRGEKGGKSGKKSTSAGPHVSPLQTAQEGKQMVLKVEGNVLPGFAREGRNSVVILGGDKSDFFQKSKGRYQRGLLLRNTRR
jgi:hypothetical protein